jgi:hypothetical protein
VEWYDVLFGFFVDRRVCGGRIGVWSSLRRGILDPKGALCSVHGPVHHFVGPQEESLPPELPERRTGDTPARDSERVGH